MFALIKPHSSTEIRFYVKTIHDRWKIVKNDGRYFDISRTSCAVSELDLLCCVNCNERGNISVNSSSNDFMTKLVNVKTLLKDYTEANVSSVKFQSRSNV